MNYEKWLEINKFKLEEIFNNLMKYCIQNNIIDKNDNYIFRESMRKDFYLYTYYKSI